MDNNAAITLEFLQEVFDALISHICVVDHTGQIIITNAAWQQFADQNNGSNGCEENYLEICAAAAADGCAVAGQFRQGLLDVLENRVPCFILEYDCHSPQELRWFVCRITRLVHQGQPLAVVSHQNVTNKILAEQTLEQSEAMFKATFDQAIAGMVQCDLEGRFLRVNQAFCRITGYPEAELLEKTFIDITVPEDLIDAVNRAHQLIAGDYSRGYTLEKRYLRKDRSVIWVNLHVSLVHHHDGSPHYFVGVVEDITDRKRAEARIQELNLRLEQRLNLLTRPEAEAGDLHFQDLFDLDEIQQLQNLLAKSLGIGSIITDLDGQPLTQPSNFCQLCYGVIRQTEKGRARCMASNAVFGVDKPGQSFVAHCHSAGLLDGGTSIFVGERRIANWVVGQVLDESMDPELIMDYADEIGADREQFRQALALVPRMSQERFQSICNLVAQIAQQLSTLALRNYQQARAIEERIRAKEVLEEQKNNLQQTTSNLQIIIDTIGDGITLSDAEGRFIIYNHQMEQITGYSMEEVNSTGSFMRLLYPTQAEQREVLEDLALLEKHGEIRNLETTITAKNGARRTLSVSTVIMGLEGERQYLTAWHDFTNRKQITDALIASEQRLRSLIETTSEGFSAIDPVTHQTVMVNQSLCTMLGYSREELLGRQTIEFTSTKQHEVLQRYLNQLPETDRRSYELELVTKDGSLLPTHFSASTLRDEHGTPVLAYAFITDISERKRYEAEIQHAREVAEAASRAKSSFLANMSHELRTPLNSIIGFTELVHDGITGPISELQQEYLGNVLTSSRHLLQIISEILDLSRIEAGKLKLELAPLSLDNLLLQVQTIFAEQARSNEIALTVAAEHPRGMLITADEVKLRQVIINLVSNALKFTSNRGIVEISTAVHDYPPDGACLVVKVKDTGIGIKEEDLPRLFQEFSQIDSSLKRNRNGTGLGLALSKRLVELHGGWIRVASSYGFGSTFSVILPQMEKQHHD